MVLKEDAGGLPTRNLTIIIPHYSKQEALKKTWEELRLQIHQEDEVLIVDDHSPDGVPDLDCPCSRVIRPPKLDKHIYRLCTLRNLGLQEAKYDQCIILDPDCLPNPYFVDNARKIYDASILYGGCIDKMREDGTIKQDTRRNSNQSYWCDYRDKGGGCIWGGVMMFSKSRTKLVGWFDEDFNGAWGAEESEFSSKCYHSGMRLRYSMELSVVHQWHPKNDFGKGRNKKIYQAKIASHKSHLSTFTPYKPAVGVMVITMLRPELIDQCLRSVFKNRIPLKLRLINNGDDGEQTRRICSQWGRRWAVDYVYHERRWPARIRNETWRWAINNNFKYLVFIDDDILVTQDGIVKLIKTIEENPEYYAISGCLKKPRNQRPQMLGGVHRDNAFWSYPRKIGLHESDWVGGGFTVHKVNPMLPYDEQYQTGYNDFDWSLTAKKHGYKLGVTGDAGAYHGYIITKKGLERYKNPAEYSLIRYDEERHKEMRRLFKNKWDFEIGVGGLWKGE